MAIDIFDTPGITQWTSPITGTARVRCWGAGAGGGVHSSGEGGGGGGSYAEGDFPVIEKQAYDVVVGDGGGPGVAGGDTYFDDGSMLYAPGGQPGLIFGIGGGLGGPVGLGEITWPGGNGGNGSGGIGLRAGGGGGAGAGPAGSGSNGGNAAFDAPGAGGIGPGGNGGNGGGAANNGQSGTAPGGGGGGGGDSGGNAGTGASGRVEIQYSLGANRTGTRAALTRVGA